MNASPSAAKVDGRSKKARAAKRAAKAAAMPRACEPDAWVFLNRPRTLGCLIGQKFSKLHPQSSRLNWFATAYNANFGPDLSRSSRRT